MPESSRPMPDAIQPVRMRDRPILFSAPMVRALIREAREPGTGKTMTRRILKPQPKFGFQPWQDESNGDWMQSGYGEAGDDFLAVPYAVGDRLWVREAFSGLHEYEAEKWPPNAWFSGDPIWYWADGNPIDGDWTRPKPSIHMPRWASRLTLVVAEVRVERLNDISEADAVAEGLIKLPASGRYVVNKGEQYAGLARHTARARFSDLWNSLHGPDAWQANPWVSVTRFRPVIANIDVLAQAEPSQGREAVR